MFLLRGPGYELALVFGLVGPFVASLWVALGRSRAPVFGSLARGAWVSAAVLLVAFLGGLQSPACERGQAYALMLLGPTLGTVLAALCTEAALFARLRSAKLQRIPRALIGLLMPLAPICIGLYGIYASPAVFAYSEFVGYFAGPLYDRVEYRFETLLSYRAGSILLGVGLSLLLRKQAVRLGILCLGGYFLVRSLGDQLGHETSAESLSRALSGQVRFNGCLVTYAEEKTSRAEAELIARECSVHLGELAEYFEVEPEREVLVRLFGSVEEKARWTGAGRTYVAKPWRGEIYVHSSGYPHPTLRHELAHIVAARFGRGPFRIAGELGGWIPDPGRIEGFAVAAAPHENSDGTLLEWARAQVVVGAMPPLRRLFQFGFYGESSARAYGAAGAFIAYLREEYGAGALRAWYGGADLEELTGQSIAELERGFHRALERETVPEVVQSAARARYSGPATLERICPHAVDRILARAERTCSLDPRAAERLASQAWTWEPRAREASLFLSRCYLGAGASDEARRLLGPVPGEPPWTEEQKREGRADLDWLEGRAERALDAYRELLSEASSSGQRRALWLKIWALTDARGSADETLVRELLARRAGPVEIVSYLAQSAESEESEFLRAYLLGRALLSLGQPGPAADAFLRAQTERAPSLEFEQENERSLMVSLCQARRSEEAKQVFESLDLSTRSAARRLELEGIQRRCLP
jgi:hypothetical protein